MLAERIAEIIPRYSMWAPGDRVGVAVSGGADSVVLLHLLNRVQLQFGAALYVLHVNHGLRGAESDEDEQFVRELARSLDLPCHAERLPPAPGNLEQEARRARRALYEKLRAAYGLARVALGHTRSDQAETVLLRLFRGAGLSGLSGMRFVSEGFFIRPLLNTGRHEIRTWAEAEGIRWREDSSNGRTEFARNYIRLHMLPEIAQHLNPNVEGILTGTAELAQAEEDDWVERVEEAFRVFAGRTRLGLFFRVADLQALSIALQRRLIRRALAELRHDALRGLDYEHIESVRALTSSTEGHDRVLIPGADALRSYGTLLLAEAGKLGSEPRGYRIALRLNCWNELPFGAGRLYVSEVNPGSEVCASFKKDPAAVFEWAEFSVVDLSSEVRLVARNWEPGDRILRPGHSSAEKIKTLFQEDRVLLWERRHWPVVVLQDEVLWVRRFGAAQTPRSAGASGKKVWLGYVSER